MKSIVLEEVSFVYFYCVFHRDDGLGCRIGGPSAVATLALQEKQHVKETAVSLVGGTNQVSPKQPGEGRWRAEWTLTLLSRRGTQTPANKTAGHSTML